jgi:hypothetical protein
MERAEGVKARARYKSNVKKMGQRIDAFCKLDFRENSYIPMTTMKYSGPL